MVRTHEFGRHLRGRERRRCPQTFSFSRNDVCTRAVYCFGRGWQKVAEKGEFGVWSERRVDLNFSNSMRVNERRESSRKLLNELGGRFFIII